MRAPERKPELKREQNLTRPRRPDVKSICRIRSIPTIRLSIAFRCEKHRVEVKARQARVHPIP